MWLMIYDCLKNIIYILGLLFILLFLKGLCIGISNGLSKSKHKNHINGIYDINCKLCREEIKKFNKSNEGFRRKIV